jgi:hypothetical protein
LADHGLLVGVQLGGGFERQTQVLVRTIALADPAGSPSTSYTYGPYGAVTTTGAATGNTQQYTGRPHRLGDRSGV